MLALLLACAHQIALPPAAAPPPSAETAASDFLDALAAGDAPRAGALVETLPWFLVNVPHSPGVRLGPPWDALDPERMFDTLAENPSDVQLHAVEPWTRSLTGEAHGFPQAGCRVAGPGRTQAVPVRTQTPIGAMADWLESVDAVAEAPVTCEGPFFLLFGKVGGRFQLWSVVLVRRGGDWRIAGLDYLEQGYAWEALVGAFELFEGARAP